MSTEAYPLCWPAGRPRSKRRESGAFKTKFAAARNSLVSEIRLLGGKHVIVSSNIPLKRDGMPYASWSKIEDEGVAVYFEYCGAQMCFACDRWTSAAANMQAIRKTIEALRGISRWGTGDMLQAAFTGFTALPPPQATDWRSVLGIGPHATLDEARAAYRRKASEHHPDRGGSADAMVAINNAWSAAQGSLQ